MEDLQSLLEKINREGVEKAEAEAARIIGDAKAKAEAIVGSANDEAKKTRAAADKDSAAYAERANVTIKESARDIILGIKDAVSALLERLLAKNVNAALADDKQATELVFSAIKGLTGPGEIAAVDKLAAALKAQLAKLGTFTVVTDETLGNGFSVRLENGRIEHSFTAETITAELARRLRPDLAALVK